MGAPCRRVTLATEASLTGCPRSVEWLPSHMAHQLPGDAGRVSSTQTLSTRPERSPCVGASRHPVEAGPEAQEWMLHPEVVKQI